MPSQLLNVLAGYVEIIHLTNRPFSTLNSESYYSVHNLSFLLDAPAHTTVYVWCTYVYMGNIGGPLCLPLPSLLEGQKGIQCLQIGIHECKALL